MSLPTLKDLDVSQKRVLVRADLDVSDNDLRSTNYRIQSLVPTLEYLIKQKSKIILIGKRGRPEGKVSGALSLNPLAETLSKVLNQKVNFIYDIAGHEAQVETQKLKSGQIAMLENLRFDSREKENSEVFAKSLASLADCFVNESFAVSHRKHASLIGLPKLLPSAIGMHFEKEIQNLSKVTQNPQKPVISIISGFKDDKLKYISDFKKFSDIILLGGRLPDYVHDASPLRKDKKVIVGGLITDKEDITPNSIEKFEGEIKKAKTIVVSGPLGKFEEDGHRQGTQRIFSAVANTKAFKVAGGGDTLAAINLLKLEKEFDWLSVGGGAMLEYLATGTLPSIKALTR